MFFNTINLISDPCLFVFVAGTDGVLKNTLIIFAMISLIANSIFSFLLDHISFYDFLHVFLTVNVSVISEIRILPMTGDGCLTVQHLDFFTCSFKCYKYFGSIKNIISELLKYIQTPFSCFDVLIF